MLRQFQQSAVAKAVAFRDLRFTYGVMLAFTLLPTAAKSAESEAIEIPEAVASIIADRCADCHSGDSAEANLRLDEMAAMSLDQQLDVLNKAQDQIFFRLMPPEDADPMSGPQREALAGWLRSELRKHNASKLDEKLREPSYGNFVDHEKLFDGSVTDKPFTPARRWLVSPQIFDQRVNAVFQLTGRDRQTKFYGVTNPIVLPDQSGVRYYDTTALDGGHLLVMLGNAQWIASKQVFGAVHSGIDRQQVEFPNPKDRWYPMRTPAALVEVLKASKDQVDGVPSDLILTDAIHAQFDCVLQRRATEDELARYLPLLRSGIELAGAEAGLRQMLVSVLLESEFLYRIEFGEGEPDADGRRLLSPREASYAIAYALSDQNPDPELLAAAAEGRLATKADFHREVTRLLQDDRSFFGPVDPAVATGHIRPHVVTHPKLVRFFREFFGYPNSIKLFKDVVRSGGFYDNAGRDYTGTAGSVTNEADRVVDHILKDDRDVFARLLTTDEFFVLHTQSNQQGQKTVDNWYRAYQGLKDLNWKDNVEQTLLDHFEERRELFKLIKIDNLREDRRKVHVREFGRYMTFFENTFGKGRTPITFPWFFHGGQKFRYSEIYSLPPVAGAGPLDYKGRYSRGGYEAEATWDFPIVQPFRIANRKGILTHPAWLLAHSQNTETDPVRRGRWIREKLLAGRVPDVPITVDAQIPEDHHRTLRQRLDSVTTKQECWKCHQQMNPLGLPFEVFDDFGRFRTRENLEHEDNIVRQEGPGRVPVYKTQPVSAEGFLEGTGDSSLDGEVADAFDLIDRLAASARVRQSIIRHAFRFFLGRNELLSDSQTLIDADRAYLESGGSFQAVVVSLLTSDSFMYRKRI